MPGYTRCIDIELIEVKKYIPIILNDCTRVNCLFDFLKALISVFFMDYITQTVIICIVGHKIVNTGCCG